VSHWAVRILSIRRAITREKCQIHIPILVPRHLAELALRISMLLPLGTAVASLMAAPLYHRQMSLLPMNCELMALLSDMQSTLCND